MIFDDNFRWQFSLSIFDDNFHCQFSMTIFDDNCWRQLLTTIVGTFHRGKSVLEAGTYFHKTINRWHWRHNNTMFICDLFQPCKYQSILRHVYTTMFSQALFTFESFVAIIALESLLLIVGYFVALQITSWNKTVRALVTLVWLFSVLSSCDICDLFQCYK